MNPPRHEGTPCSARCTTKLRAAVRPLRLLLTIVGLTGGRELSLAAPPPHERQVIQHEPVDLTLTAAEDPRWWEDPVKAVFRHPGSGREVPICGFWDGDRSWVIRFAPPLAGAWTFETQSTDSGLNAQRGRVVASPASREQRLANPNFRGPLAVSPNGRHFVRADGTPFLLLADTGWALNTARGGLGENRDGPFYQYLADRRAKGFTAILLKHMSGIGASKDPSGQRNEHGCPFALAGEKELNPAYFRGLDVRVRAIWEFGCVHAMPVAWFERKCYFSLEEARRISAYLMTRYGAFPGLFALAGEYQYAFRDCGWAPSDFDGLGRVVQARNSYAKPLSIHPSSNTRWPPPHNVQSSQPYHDSGWLDHHWLQTGQRLPQLCNVILRTLENRALLPARPVFLSESHYERASDPDPPYHARWQAWAALLSGAAGYGYGAWGVWQFLDPSDPAGETGNHDSSSSIPWWEGLAFTGSTQVGYVRRLLDALPWWVLEPRRDALSVDGQPAPLPGPDDISPPVCAAAGVDLFVAYLPRGNARRRITLGPLGPATYRARWYNPRSGVILAISDHLAPLSSWEIPPRPEPADEDWVIVVEGDPRGSGEAGRGDPNGSGN